MKLKPYKELVKMAKDAKRELLAPVRAVRARKQAELEVAKMDETIATMETKIHEMCTLDAIDFHEVIDKQDELALVERRREQFLKVIEELFPEE